MKYKYIATEKSLDIRHFEILSDKKLTQEEIEDAMACPDIDNVGDTKLENGVQATYLRTEYADDSHVNYYLESFEHTIRLIEGGKIIENKQL
tara:strand:- start:495 stop:770 length:276 start_codon:yes stop_codon:yes gene_type:complete